MNGNWYTYEDSNSERRIELLVHPRNRYHNISDIDIRHLPAAGWSNKEVSISGQSANWVYSTVAAHALTNGAKSVEVVPADGESVQVFPPCGDPVEMDLLDIRLSSAGVYLCEFLEGPTGWGGKWDPSIIPKLYADLRALQHANAVRFTGRGGVWMYAAAAAAAVSAGIPTVLYSSPRELEDLIVCGDGRIPRAVSPQSKPPVKVSGNVFGVVGDPGSGKSILSKALVFMLRQRNQSTWLLDCDGQSPTPYWYVELMQDKRFDEAAALREKSKVDWSREMELEIVRQIRNLKVHYAVSLADLPGGNHSVSPPMRIPPGREDMMREVDRFIILGQMDKPAITEGWREELGRHGLADRIVAEVVSTDPKALPTAQLTFSQDMVRGRITGLDRSNRIADFSASSFADGIDPLIRCLLSERTMPDG
jgi:hypothetical protein